MKRLRRMISLLLVLILCFGLVPGVSAAEADTPGVNTEPESTQAGERTTPDEETQAEETTSPSTEPETEAAEGLEEEALGDESEIMAFASDDYAVMSIASTQNSIMLFDYADNGNYTTVLNSQVTCTYKPNGTDTTRTAYIKNLGWHFARYGGVAYADDPIYCIEPWRTYAASTSGNSVDRGVTLDGSGSTTGSNVWFALPAARREAIGLILLYSNQMWDHSISVTTTSKANNPNVPLRVATQFLIYEIVCGLRDPNTFTLNSTNECGTSGDVFYNAGVDSVSDFAPNYNTLVSYIQSAMKIPSFTSKSSSSVPTITLSGTSTSVTDSNGVLSNFSFSNGSGASFSKSGNTLTITQTGTISESTIFTTTRYAPSATSSTYNIWYMSGSTYQTCINLYSASSGNLNAYFKLKAPALGAIGLTKTTEDGKNLSGWQFGIYANSACTSLVSGPHTTDSSGKISVTGLTPGTYYVKELGHTDSTINALYYCASTNPQSVTVSAGATATVSFTNKLNTGSVKLVKTTNTGQNLSGWQIGLYYDAACTSPVSGAPFTTGTDGTVTVSALQPGTLYAKEIAGSDPYWEYDSAVKTVTVVVNQTASVTFSNTHYGRIEFQKTTNTRNTLGGWTFRVRDADGNIVGDYTTDDNGYACTENLPLGRYTVVELPTEDDYWTGELGFHDVTVQAGKTTVDTWLNREQGLGWFYKKTNTGESVEGWHITVYADEACTEEIGTLITNDEGKAGYYLDPGTYWAKETGDEYGRFEDEYWMVDETVQKFEIKPHEETSVTFTNFQYGRIQVIKTLATDGTAEGWQFKITDAEGKEIMGSPFTSSADGKIATGNLLPGEYIIEELIPENSLFYCDTENPQTVIVTQGEIAEVTFTNALGPGRISVQKVDTEGTPRAGAEFLLEWSVDGKNWMPVVRTDSDYVSMGACSSKGVADGKLISGEDGIVTFEGLYPTLQYRLTETKAPEGFQLLTEPVYEGTLPAEEDLTVCLTVVNVPTFKLPETGSKSLILSSISLCVCLTGLVGSILYLRRKERG